MGNDGTCADGSFNAAPGGTAIKLDKDVEFKVRNYYHITLIFGI